MPSCRPRLRLRSHYPFVSIEDPFDQDDFEAYKMFMDEVPGWGLSATAEAWHFNCQFGWARCT